MLLLALGFDQVGTAGDDVIMGTALPDNLCGLEGNDTLYGLEHNDHIDGGTGADTMVGGESEQPFWQNRRNKNQQSMRMAA